MAWRRHAGWIAAVAIIIAVIIVGFLPRPVLVDSAVVMRGRLSVTVEEEGRTRVKDRYVVSAPVAGFIRRIELDVGDSVDKDQTIAYLDPVPSTVLDPRTRAEAEARVAAAKAALKVAVEQVKATAADLSYAEAELFRLQRLYDSNNVSRDALQAAQSRHRKALAAHQSAQFSVDVAGYELKAAEAALQYSAAKNGGAPETVEIRSPVKGDVLKILHKSEGVVDRGQPLLELGNPLSLEVEVDVLSRDAVQMQPGTRVILKRWGGDPLNGVVRLVEPVGFTKISALGVEEQRVLVIVDITSPPQNWSRLGDSYRVEAEFILWQGDNVLQVPVSALFRVQDEWATFVVTDGRARLRNVKIGRRGSLDAEVLSGLEENDVVITHPGDTVADGARVRSR
jgi:HlyD family secretion protein